MVAALVEDVPRAATAAEMVEYSPFCVFFCLTTRAPLAGAVELGRASAKTAQSARRALAAKGRENRMLVNGRKSRDEKGSREVL